MSDVTQFAVLRNGRIFTLRMWPAKVPNPRKYRWQVYADGALVGAAKTKADAERRINEGFYDE